MKRRMANVFMATETMESDIFRKYCDRIASDLGMPCQTPDERENVFEACLDLPSLRQKGSLPKLGRWFSWNGVASEQMVEYNTIKMLFEHHLQANTDPDANPVGFDMRALAESGLVCTSFSLGSFERGIGLLEHFIVHACISTSKAPCE